MGNALQLEIYVTTVYFQFIQGTAKFCCRKMANNFIVSNFEAHQEDIATKQTLGVYVVSAEKQQPGFVIQCFVWGDRSWPIRARLGDLLCRSAQDTEREAALSAASREVTIEQHHWGLLSVKFGKRASKTAGCVLQNTVYTVVLFTNTHMRYYWKTKYTTKICMFNVSLSHTPLIIRQTSDENVTKTHPLTVELGRKHYHVHMVLFFSKKYITLKQT